MAPLIWKVLSGIYQCFIWLKLPIWKGMIKSTKDSLMVNHICRPQHVLGSG